MTKRPAWAYSYALFGLTNTCDQCLFHGIKPTECLDSSAYISPLWRYPLYLTFSDDGPSQPTIVRFPISSLQNSSGRPSIFRFGYFSLFRPSLPAYAHDNLVYATGSLSPQTSVLSGKFGTTKIFLQLLILVLNCSAILSD